MGGWSMKAQCKVGVSHAAGDSFRCKALTIETRIRDDGIPP